MEAIAEAPEVSLLDVVVAEAIEFMMMATIGAPFESMAMETIGFFPVPHQWQPRRLGQISKAPLASLRRSPK